MKYFPLSLTPQEKEVLYNTPLNVTVLIAGADGDINEAEVKKAMEMAEYKKVNARPELVEYYKWASEDFENRLASLLGSLSPDKNERAEKIIAELAQLNDILPRLDHRFAVEFYYSIKDYAKKIAKSSGGILGYLSIGYEESKLINLDMINDPESTD